MGHIFFSNLSIALTAMIVFYVIGEIFFRLFSLKVKGAFTNLFLKQLTGIFLFTAISALFFTRLHTIFLGLVIPFLYFLYWRRRNGQIFTNVPAPPSRQYAVPALLMFLVVCILFGYRFYSVAYNGHTIPNIPNTDFTFYSRISHFIMDSGVESATPSLSDNRVNPYHYFDLWINSGLTYFWKGNNLLVLFLVSYTLGIALVWLGFCALAEQLKRLTLLDCAFALLAVFFLPLQSSISEAINGAVNPYFILTHAPPEYLAYGLWNLTKTYPVYLIFIASAIALLKKQTTLAIISLSTLLFVYTTISVPVILFLSIYVLIDYLLISRNASGFLTHAGYLAVICIYIFGFYFSYLFDSVGGQINPFYRWGVEPLYKTVLRPVKICVDATIQLFILYLPFIVLLVLNWGFKRVPRFGWAEFKSIANDRVAKFAIIVYVSSLASWAIFTDFIDANQFFAKTGVVMLNIVSFIILISLKKTWLKILAVALSLYFIHITTQDIFEQRLYSEEYMLQVRDVTEDASNVAGYLLDKADYQDGYGDNIVEVLGDYITLFRPDYFAVNLSVTDLPVSPEVMESDSVRRRLEHHDFYKFINRQKSENRFQSVANSRVDFINEFNVDYIIASPHVVLDSTLERRVKRRIVDNYSGQVLLIVGPMEQ